MNAKSAQECRSPLPLSIHSKHTSTTGDDHAKLLPRKNQSARGRAHSYAWRLLVALCALVFCAVAASAQTFNIDSFTIDGGGGVSTGGTFAVSGTIGQPDANTQPLTGGNFSLTGGFWSLFAVHTAGAPPLSIRLASASTAVVSWPSPSTGFMLQQNADLNTTNWIAAPQSVSDDGINKFITVNPPTGNRFYRLFKP